MTRSMIVEKMRIRWMSERQSLGSSCEVKFGPSWPGERHVFGVAENLGRTWC